MNKVTIDLTEEQLCTVITALKVERSIGERGESETARAALPYIQNALDAILNQPWKYRH